MNRQPFINVSWSRPFLPALIDIALDLTGGGIGDALCVFPHTRPALYMTDAIRHDERIPKPCLLPRMESVSGLFSLIRSGSRHGRRHGTVPVGMLDQVALLLAVVRELRETRGGLLRDLPLDDSKRFFPWGVRLANLMEEFFIHNREPDDYIHMEGQVTPFAAALLENLGSIHARYTAALEERGWTTPGLDAMAVVRALAAGENVTRIPGIAGKRIILAGFHTLTGAQHVLFRTLWEQYEAVVCLHADPKIVRGTPHWSCTDLVRWAGAWGTTIVPHGELSATGLPEEPDGPKILFRAGYDVHSQIACLTEELAQTEGPDGQKADKGKSGPRAVVLPDTSLLMPVLHHLPEADRNISMGYPLARSPLFRLVESILSLQENRRGTGPYAYHWKALIALLRHPYLKMLDPAPVADERKNGMGRAASGSKDGAPSKITNSPHVFRQFLHAAERVVRTSSRFAPVTDLGGRAAATFATPNAPSGTGTDARLTGLFARILDAAIFGWENISTPADLATALQGLADLMLDHGAALWSHFPIDAECLYRLTESIIPQLAHTALKEERLPPETLFTVLRSLLAEERVPFDAYPLVGDQVLGMLETRLLHFDRLFILDLTEDRLPGTSGHDPLLPDSLRPLASLPGKQGREKVAAYNFFRLISGAKHVTLYWQEGVSPQGLGDAKKVRSRFVEELLWREEEKRGRLLAPERPENAGEDGPYRMISCVLPSVPREHKAIPVSSSAKARMAAILQGDLSPSLLDSYLRCPARFFYQRIGRIREVEGVVEGRDAMGTGTFLHEVLRGYFAERLNAPVMADTASLAAIRDKFLNDLANSEIYRTLPADDRIMLEEAAPPILQTLLENHAGRVPLHLEEKFRAGLLVDGTEHTLAGVIDRVDKTPAGLVVMDYKTGRVPLVNSGVWQDTAFWKTLSEWVPDKDGMTDPLETVAKEFASVQLPAYIHMVRSQTGETVHDAAYVPLRMGAKDSFLFDDKADAALRAHAVAENIPLLLEFLIRHMASTKVFAPRPDKNCNWCLYSNLCIIASR